MTEPRDPETRTDPVDPENPWRPVEREEDESSADGASYDPTESIVRAEGASAPADPQAEPVPHDSEDGRAVEPGPALRDEPATQEEPVRDEAPVRDEPVVQEEAGADVEGERPGEPVGTPVGEPEDDTESTHVIERPEAGGTEPTSVMERPETEGTEPTHVIERQETDGTERLEVPAAVGAPVPAPVAGPTPPADAIFRPPSPVSPTPEPTRVEPLSEEEQRLADERAARREARVAAFAAPAAEPAPEPQTVVVHKRTNDRFWGSLGLFLLRLVLVGIFTIRGLNLLTDLPAAEAQFAQTVLADYPPGALMWALITGVACVLIALSLLLGLLTRVAGLGVALIAGGALAFVYWGPWSPIVPGRPGFWGEYELLLAAVGLLLLCIGAGGWSLDRSFRAGRERNKRERAAETG